MAGGSGESDLSNQLNILYRAGVVGDHSDGRLVQRWLTATDEAAGAVFTVLVERHGPMVLRVCRQVLGDQNDADDAFQATFLVLARRAGSVRKAESLASWLHGVALRVAKRARADAARRRLREREVGALKQRDSHDEGAPRESWPELHQAIDRLPERYREPVVLCYLEGLTVEAAALRIGCPRGTVLSRLSRGRDRLRRTLSRHGLPVPPGLVVDGQHSGVSPAPEAVPPALLGATVNTALGFAGRGSIEASVASTTAQHLARGVIQAMTISRLRTLGAAALVCTLAAGGVQGLAYQLGGPTDLQPAEATPKVEDRQAALSRSVEDLQRQLDEADKRNAALRKSLQQIQAELKALRPASPPAKEAASPAQPPPGPTLRKMNNLVFASSTYGDRVVLRDTDMGRTSTLEFPASKESPLNVQPIFGPSGVALRLEGSNITRLAVADPHRGFWVAQELREPFSGTAIPHIGPNAVTYSLSRDVYVFSNIMKRWGMIRRPDGVNAAPVDDGQSVTIEDNGHILTFNIRTATWSDLDAKTLLEAPPDEPRPPKTARPGRGQGLR